jgi:hypothetical protein
MNTSALRTVGASAVLVVGLVSCGSPAAEPGSAESTAKQEISAAPVATVAPTPTPTSPKTYTAEELSGLIGQLKDAKGLQLSVMSMADLSGNLEQTKALLSSMTVEPAECQEMAISGTASSVEGATAAMGTSLDATNGACIDGLSSVPGTFAYQTDTLMPNGQNQSMITAQAVSQGVLINVMSAGGASQAEAVSRAGAMLDQAAALVR